MRVTGGVLKGRTAECPEGEIRPTMDKVRESLFGILGSLEGKSFLDLFGGSGIVSLEASSRGAGPVWHVEKDRGKAATILKNVSAAPGKIVCKFTACELFLRRNRKAFDIVFCDPPFPYRYRGELLRDISASGSVAAGGICIMHRPKEQETDDHIGSLELFDRRIYGRSVLDMYKNV